MPTWVDLLDRANHTGQETVADIDAEASADGQVPTSDGAGNVAWEDPTGGGGDVTGPASSTDDDIATFNLATGKVIKDSGVQVATIATAQTTADDHIALATAAHASTAISDGSTAGGANVEASLDVLDLKFGGYLARNGGQMVGNITMSGLETVDGRDLSVDGAKLDGLGSGGIGVWVYDTATTAPADAAALGTGKFRINATSDEIYIHASNVSTADMGSAIDSAAFGEGALLYLQSDIDKARLFLVDVAPADNTDWYTILVTEQSASGTALADTDNVMLTVLSIPTFKTMGLGTVSQLAAIIANADINGTAVGDIVRTIDVGGASALPVMDGSNLNGVTATHANHTGDVTSVGLVTTIAADTIGVAELDTTGTPDGSLFLRDDMQWTAAGGGGGDPTVQYVRASVGTTINAGDIEFADNYVIADSLFNSLAAGDYLYTAVMAMTFNNSVTFQVYIDGTQSFAFDMAVNFTSSIDQVVTTSQVVTVGASGSVQVGLLGTGASAGSIGTGSHYTLMKVA